MRKEMMPEEDGETDPKPFSVIVTPVALPPKVLPLIVTDFSVPQTDSLSPLSESVGGFIHSQNT
jgi:hypothetical protein